MSNEPGFKNRPVSATKRHAPPPKKDAPGAETLAPVTLPQGPPAPEVYYSGPNQDFWIRTAQGEFTRCSDGELRRRLSMLGLSPLQRDTFIVETLNTHAI